MVGRSSPGTRKVLIFVPTLGGGGAEMQATRLANGLAQMGFEVTCATAREGGSYERLLRSDVLRVPIVAGIKGSSTIRLIRSLAGLQRLIDDRRPDAVLGFMFLPSIVAIAAVRRSKTQPKVVAVVQNSPVAKFGGSFTIGKWIQRTLVRKVFPLADHVISLSRGVRDELTTLVPSIDGRVSVVHNAGPPRETEPPASVRAPVEKEGWVLLACGRLVPQKGYPVLLRAFAAVQNEMDDVRLLIVGQGPLERDLKGLADELGIHERVSFLGFRDDVINLMRGADVFVLSSLWEGFGNVLVEAMSQGVPVIAADCAHGPAEVLQGGEAGVLVPVGDSSALAEAITRLLRDPEARARFRAEGLRRAADFEIDAISGQYAEIIRSITPCDESMR